MNAPMRLTTARIVTLAVGLPFALALIGWSALNFVALAASSSIQIVRTIPADGGAISANVDSGDLNFVPSPDGEVRVKGVVDYHLFRPTITISGSEAGVDIDLSCPAPIRDPCSAHLTVQVPAQSEVTASTSFGDIAATDLKDVSLQTTTGNLTVSAISGAARLEVTSGTIRSSDLNVATMTASDVSGQVSLAFATVPSNVSVDDTSGSVLVTVPSAGAPYLVTAHSTSGSTAIGVPTDPSSSHVISITTVSGSISVEPGG